MMKRLNRRGDIINFDPQIKDIGKLLKIYASLQDAILSKVSDGMRVFSTKNIVGEYAEILCCEKLDLTQEVPSNTDYDATFADRTYQIKARQVSKDEYDVGERMMGDISENALDSIDYVIVVLFDSDFTVNAAFNIPSHIYKLVATYVSTRKKYRLVLNTKNIEKLKSMNCVADLKDTLNS